MRTTDGGETWQVVTPPGLAVGRAGRSISGMDALDAGHAWVTYAGIADGSPQTLTSTSDGGRTWSTLGRLPSSQCTVQFVTASDGWCVAVKEAMGQGQVIVYRTTDGGRRWSLVSASASPVDPRDSGTPGSLPVGCDKDVRFSTSLQGWAGFYCAAGGVAPIYETTDAGHSWRAAVIGPPPPSPAPVSGSGWVALPTVAGLDGAAGLSSSARDREVSLVYRTTDGGKTWRPVVPPGPARAWGIDLVNATDWKLTSGREILATDDAGRRWHEVTSGVPLGPEGVSDFVPDFVTSQIGWWPTAGSEDVLRTTDGGATWRHVRIPGVGADGRIVRCSRHKRCLTGKEFDILAFLAGHVGKVCAHQMILEWLSWAALRSAARLSASPAESR